MLHLMPHPVSFLYHSMSSLHSVWCMQTNAQLFMYINNHLHTERTYRKKTNKQKNVRLKAIRIVFHDVIRMDYCAPGTYFISKTATYWQYCAINQMTPKSCHLFVCISLTEI